MTDKPEQFQLKWKSIAVVMIMVCASVLVTAYATGAGNGGNSIPVVIESGSGVETASYIIYKDGDYTCLKNGTTGRIIERTENDSHPIQAGMDAINTGSASGGVLYLAQGTYEIDYPIYVRSNIIFTGSGPRTIVSASNLTINGVTNGVGAANFTIRDMSIVGPGATDVVAANGLSLVSCSNVLIENVHVYGWSDDGLIVHGPNTNNIKITECVVHDCNEGIEIKGGTNYTVSNNRVYDLTTGEAVEITDRRPWDNSISQVIIENNWLTGVSRGIWVYGNVTETIIQSNDVVCAGYAAIEATIKDASAIMSYITITDNNLHDSYYGVYLTSGTFHNWTISDNTIENCYQYGFNHQVAIKDFRIVSNRISNIMGAASGCGINLKSTAVNVQVSDNYVAYTKKAGMNIYGTGILVSGNVFVMCGETAMYVWIDNVLISSNYIKGGTICGIYIVAQKNVTVIGNIITSALKPVRSFTGSDYNYILGNNFKGCTGDLLLVGTHNVVANNTGI